MGGCAEGLIKAERASGGYDKAEYPPRRLKSASSIEFSVFPPGDHLTALANALASRRLMVLTFTSVGSASSYAWIVLQGVGGAGMKEAQVTRVQ